MTRAQRAAILATAAFSIAWLNPERDQVTAGNQSYDAGKYDEAITAYGQALVDDPDSPLLNFNMGTASYKAGKYTEAMASFGRVGGGGGDAVADRAARTAYNTGNVYYRLGVAAEATKPQEALTAYANALVAYRHAIGLDPADADAKFNYEFVSKKIDDLKKKLEEQQQQQDKQQQDKQQQDQQQQDQQKQDQQKQDEQQQGQQDQQQKEQQEKDQQQQPQDGDQQQQQADKSQQEKEQEQKQAAQDQAQKDGEQQEAQPEAAKQEGEAGHQADATEGERREGMSPQEAAALIDTARGDELQPDEFVRRLQGTGVAEPAQDW